MAEDPDFARRIAEVEINLLTLEMMNLSPLAMHAEIATCLF